MNEIAHLRRHRLAYVPHTEREGGNRHERAMRAMEAANLAIGQLCVNMLEGRDAFDGLSIEEERRG